MRRKRFSQGPCRERNPLFFEGCFARGSLDF